MKPLTKVQHFISLVLGFVAGGYWFKVGMDGGSFWKASIIAVVCFAVVYLNIYSLYVSRGNLTELLLFLSFLVISRLDSWLAYLAILLFLAYWIFKAIRIRKYGFVSKFDEIQNFSRQVSANAIPVFRTADLSDFQELNEEMREKVEQGRARVFAKGEKILAVLGIHDSHSAEILIFDGELLKSFNFEYLLSKLEMTGSIQNLLIPKGLMELISRVKREILHSIVDGDGELSLINLASKSVVDGDGLAEK